LRGCCDRFDGDRRDSCWTERLDRLSSLV
jgi:hypothetical protein